ncbi:MAG: 30S ribosomal protein S2 [Candidatus Gracilibacteria bacterium]
MSDKIYQEMVANAVHYGHRTHKWDPRMRKYLCGEKNGIHIFNLEKTVEMLGKAVDFLAKAVAEGKLILFVSTKPQAIHLVEKTAKECGMPYVVTRWIPGFITNFPTIKKRIKYLKDLKEQQETGEFDKYTKKEASKLKKQIEKLEASLGGVQELTRKPDVIFVVDVVKDKIVVEEAFRSKIPVVAIVDSNANPERVAYPIPGNDDAVRSINYLVGKVAEVIKKTKK